MSTDDTHSGIPTRAIHEAYLDMHRALKAHREARDQGNERARHQAHGQLQSNVVTLFDQLLPHLQDESALDGYWNGELPKYPGNGHPPDPIDGKGILQVQQKTQNLNLNGDMEAVQNIQSLRDWDEYVKDRDDLTWLNGNMRVVNPVVLDGGAMVQYHHYEMGLKNIKDWQTDVVSKVVDKGGFMGGDRKTEFVRQRVDFNRLENAVRELSKAANKLGALSDFDVRGKKTEITEEDIKEVEEWRQQQI